MNKVWVQIIEMLDFTGSQQYEVFRVRSSCPEQHEEFEDLERWLTLNAFTLKDGGSAADGAAAVMCAGDDVFVHAGGNQYELSYVLLEKELVR